MPTKTIVYLANSRKDGARCIAGIEFMNNQRLGEWVRPVSNRPKGEISLREQAYRDDSEPGLLDLIDITLIEPKPSGYQKENWLIVPGSQWKKAGHLNHGRLKRLATRTGPLWINDYNSRGGENDCVPAEETKKLVRSLILADVGGMVLRVSKFFDKLLLDIP
jgi:hypothetical protein